MNNMQHCGFIAIVGRPNVGKSTLLNKILGEKISITSSKPQTTRHRILGIKTIDSDQIIFVDTPGLHRGPKHMINRLMLRAANNAILDVDGVVFLIDARNWREEDEDILKKIIASQKPFMIALNKVDRIFDKEKLMNFLKMLNEKLNILGLQGVPLIPISAKSGRNIENLEAAVLHLLPEGEHYYPDDQITDRNRRFMAAELIREKLMRYLGSEVPHELTVEIEQFKEEEKLLRISAVILVERQGQKKIVIGEGGAVLKKIGRLARLDMEASFEEKVFLELWVKLKGGWTDDARALASLGYDE
ncbi:MAG: GTPase Era [Gammaproteobacteria bacterium]